MDTFLIFLKDMKNVVNNIEEYEGPTTTTVHIVLGNESTDLDSTTCTLLLSYFLQKNIYSKSKARMFAIPVLNLRSDELPLRTEVCHLLGKLGIAPECMIFRNQIDLAILQKKVDLRVSLVDHHVLMSGDEFLKNNVVQIRDHRPVDKSIATWASTVDCVIKEVGSCATLIADEIIKTDASLLCKETATLLYYTIIYDTIQLLPENGKVKDLDLQVAEKLENMFKFDRKDRKKIYEELWAAHTNVSHLTPSQLLLSDLKIVKSVPVPGVPMLVEQFLKLPESLQAVQLFHDEKEAEVVIIMGLEAREVVKRDIALYCQNKASKLLELILKKLQNANLDLIEHDLNICSLIYFQQNNIRASRKQILPLIKAAAEELL